MKKRFHFEKIGILARHTDGMSDAEGDKEAWESLQEEFPRLGNMTDVSLEPKPLSSFFRPSASSSSPTTSFDQPH
jgi:hypothetical protein